MVPKSKRGPALFDLLAEEQLRRPAGGVPSSRWTPAQRDKDAVVGLAATPATTVQPPTQPLTYHAPASEAGPRSPVAELDGDRIRFSLTSVSAAVAVFIVLVLLFGTFEVGRRSGRSAGFAAGHAAGRAVAGTDSSAPAGDVELARSQPPATHVVSELIKDPALRPGVRQPGGPTSGVPASSAPSRPADAWIAGSTYVVAQEFAAGRDEDASRAQAFLGDHGVDADRVKLANGSTLLIVGPGHNHKDPGQKSQSDQLLQKVRSIGAKYFANGGGYKLEGYYRTRKADGW